MAGILGAIRHTLSFRRDYFIPYKPYNPFHPFRSPIFNRSSKSSSFRLISAMSNINNIPDIEGPAPKAQKTDDRDGSSDHQLPFFKVKKLSEKAVLPARGSSLAAGYDLSRYVTLIATIKTYLSSTCYCFYSGKL